MQAVKLSGDKLRDVVSNVLSQHFHDDMMAIINRESNNTITLANRVYNHIESDNALPSVDDRSYGVHDFIELVEGEIDVHRVNVQMARRDGGMFGGVDLEKFIEWYFNYTFGKDSYRHLGDAIMRYENSEAHDG